MRKRKKARVFVCGALRRLSGNEASDGRHEVLLQVTCDGRGSFLEVLFVLCAGYTRGK